MMLRSVYTLKVGSIKSWNSFVDIFLKRYFPTSKTIRLRNEIFSFFQLEYEPFWKYMNRSRELLIQCPHYGLERWNLYQIAHEGLDVNSRITV